MLVRTNYGRTLGGYSHYKWKNDENMIKEGIYKNRVFDEKRKTFLLQVDEQHKFVPKSNTNLISYGYNSGPNFIDLEIGNNCNK